MTGINAPLLRYYDSIGLLIPAYRGENNYRMYSYAQVETAWMIETLRSLGMPLCAIKEHLSNYTAAGTVDILTRQLGLIDAELNKLTQTREHIVQFIDDLNLAMKIKIPFISLEEHEEMHYFIGSLIDSTADDVNVMVDFVKRCQRIQPCGLSNIGFIYPKRDGESCGGGAAYPYIQSPLGECLAEKGLYLVSYDNFYNTEGSSKHFDRIMKYVRDNGLEICGDTFEYPIVNEMAMDSRDDMLMRITIRVKRKNPQTRSESGD